LRRQSLLEQLKNKISIEIRNYTGRIHLQSVGYRCEIAECPPGPQRKLCDALSLAAIVTSVGKYTFPLGNLEKEALSPADLLLELRRVPKLGAYLELTHGGAGGFRTVTHAVCGSHAILAAFASECEKSVVGLDLEEFVKS
jgi:hypothetical protein